MEKCKLKIVVISFLDNSNIENLPILIETSTSDIKEVDIVIISVNTYYLACK